MAMITVDNTKITDGSFIGTYSSAALPIISDANVFQIPGNKLDRILNYNTAKPSIRPGTIGMNEYGHKLMYCGVCLSNATDAVADMGIQAGDIYASDPDFAIFPVNPAVDSETNAITKSLANNRSISPFLVTRVYRDFGRVLDNATGQYIGKPNWKAMVSYTRFPLRALFTATVKVPARTTNILWCFLGLPNMLGDNTSTLATRYASEYFHAYAQMEGICNPVCAYGTALAFTRASDEGDGKEGFTEEGGNGITLLSPYNINYYNLCFGQDHLAMANYMFLRFDDANNNTAIGNTFYISKATVNGAGTLNSPQIVTYNFSSNKA
jgi:hypothetical protein